MEHFINRVPYELYETGTKEYLGEHIVSAVTEHITLARGGLLAVHQSGEDGLFVQFAVFEFSSSPYHDAEVANTQYSLLFYGEGPSSSLRECRHTWWGEEGYVFYPDAALITDALEKLKKWFDMD